MADKAPGDENASPGHGRAAVQPGKRQPTSDAHAASADRSKQPEATTSPNSRVPTISPHESPFGAGLGPILCNTCGDRLGSLSWFRTDWQRGGALTGYAVYRDDSESKREVVVKLPVPPAELLWLERLQPFPDLVPKLYAHNDALGGYDFAWVVMERVPHGPLGQAWDGKEFDLLVEASGRFYAAAKNFPVDAPPPAKDWEAIFHMAREKVHEHEMQHEQRWKTALKKAHRKLKGWLAAWNARPADQWCHGDLHLANAMTRVPPPAGPALLLDFAEAHAGCWVEDAVYFEHLFWSRRHRLGGRRLCSQIAHERKRLGLKVDADWPRLASIKRALLAMSTPAVLRYDGDPNHVQAALEVLEMEVGA